MMMPMKNETQVHIMLPYEVKVDSRFGAPMGRYSDELSSFTNSKVHLRKVPFMDGDYDPGGAYWGQGPPSLFCVWNDDHVAYFRATNREVAKAMLPTSV